MEFLQVGKHDEGKFHPLLPASANELQPVHHRHADIRDNDIGLGFTDQLQGIGAVGGLSHKGAAQAFPLDQGRYPGQY